MRVYRGVLALILLTSAPTLSAEVKIDVRSDGIKVIRNEPGPSRQRRLAVRLMAIPSPKIADLVDRYSAAKDLDPRLVQAVMQVESGYNVKALSNKGAIGLMQLMPSTARELSIDDPWDPEENVRGGTTYLKKMLDYFSGDLGLALAAYNAGPNAVLENAGVPPYADTRAYVRRVLCLLDDDCEDEARQGRKVELIRDPKRGLVIVTIGSGG